MVADPMTLWQNYHIADSIADALEVLSNSPGRTTIIAGGTDLLLQVQQGQHPPIDTLVDITKIPAMGLIEIQQGQIFIGAAANHKEIANSKLIKENCRALAIACGLIGGPQVRNVGTLGGNVAHALPAADGTIALMALDAKAEIVSSSGKELVPLADLFLGPGKSSLNPHQEILTGFYVKIKQPNQASTFKRIMRPQGVAIAILNLGLWLSKTGDTVEEVRIAVGPSGPVPRRMYEAESILTDKQLNPETILDAYHAILNEANFRTSKYRSTKRYREKMVGVLLEEALLEAFSMIYV